MLMVNGLDLVLVGRFQFGSLTAYSVAASLMVFLAGTQYAIFSAMMPHAAVMHAREDPGAMGKLVVRSTRLGVSLLVLTGIPLLIYAGPILRLWIGAQYVHDGRSILAVLIVANMIRLIGVPYTAVLIGTGQQRLVIISPLMEGVSNLLASVVLGMKFGAIGVALGTLVGAVVGMLAHVCYNVPRTSREIRIKSSTYILSGILAPVLCMTPLLATLAAPGYRGVIHLFTVAAAGIISIAGSWLLLFRKAFSEQRSHASAQTLAD
jgi:O-antigen/teichoic acid export membrane protein